MKVGYRHGYWSSSFTSPALFGRFEFLGDPRSLSLLVPHLLHRLLIIRLLHKRSPLNDSLDEGSLNLILVSRLEPPLLHLEVGA